MGGCIPFLTGQLVGNCTTTTGTGEVGKCCDDCRPSLNPLAVLCICTDLWKRVDLNVKSHGFLVIAARSL